MSRVHMAKRFLAAVSLPAIAIALPAAVCAQEAPPQVSATNLAPTNPNLTEWSLIKLALGDVDSANGGAGATVAVIDGKADCRNSAIAGHCQSFGFAGGSYNSYSAHATHVAGIVAGSTSGIAPSARVLNYGVFADNGYIATGTGLSDVWKAAFNNGARVSSMSFNCAGMALCFNSFELMTMADPNMPMVYVKAAGNSGTNLATETVFVPTSMANQVMNRLIVVGSVNSQGAISAYSNRPGSGCIKMIGTSGCQASLQWKYHFLVAPGEGIYSTLPNGQMGYMSGTSMATPVVAGAVALLQARWPALKNSPETVAKILFASATDLGAPGVDDVYGYGLLNVAAAFRANGSVNLVSPSGTVTTLNTRTITTFKSFVGLSSVLADVTVYDQFGRDFKLAETGALAVRQRLAMARRNLGARLIGGSEQDWASRFFAEDQPNRGFAYYGSSADQIGGGVTAERTLRAGVDMPFKGGVAQVRLTGAGSTQTDFAADDALRPLSRFASSNMVQGSLVSSLNLRLSDRSRLMAYSMVSTGPVEPRMSSDVRDLLLTEHGFASRATLASSRDREDPSRKVGAGVGWWTRPDSRTVFGVNASAIVQRHGYLDLASDLQAFDRPTTLYNLGAAVSRMTGSWELRMSGELTHARMALGQDDAMRFTPANLVSAEVGLAKHGLLASGTERSDHLSFAFVVPPRAVSGALALNYMAPTADGLDRQVTSQSVPLSRLGAEPARIEAAYSLLSNRGWSVSLAGGANLQRSVNGAGEVMARFRLTL